MWSIAGLAISARFWLKILEYPDRKFEYFEVHYTELLIGLLVSIFPFVFLQVFGKSPLHAFRTRQTEKSVKNISIHGDGNTIQVSEDNNITSRPEDPNTTIQLLSQLAQKAEALANRIYVRSGVYLIFGVLIAFSGIAYFSLQNISVTTTQSADISTQLISLAPRFGILFFIEFIAFFFLKQYRAAMDEFRHYDTIKRNRESQLAILLIATKEFPGQNFVTVVEKANFFDQIGKLGSGETTEFLEANKLNKNELDGMKDLISELLGKLKATEKSSKP